MRPLDDARSTWQSLDQTRTLSELKNAIKLQGDSEDSPVLAQRSVYWKAFLLFESADHAAWTTILADSRIAYDSLRSHFLRAIENPDELSSTIDPLSENEESPWDALRKDEALRAEIYQDVERCMPENTYFRQPATMKMMLDILFIFCKLNPDVSYRQGMHEILAPILWVVERDAIDPSSGAESDRRGGKDLCRDMFDAKFIEHDTFTLYGLVMQNAKSFYEPSKTENPNDATMLIRCRRIFEDLLPKVDPELAEHLVKVDVVPQLFLMRWCRLLFGREFSFDNLLSMWDLLFAEDPSLELVDLISVSMLLRIRWQLLEADATMAITLLLRYPPPSPQYPPQTFVEDAVLLRRNITIETASDIVIKYSKRVPVGTLQRRSPDTQSDEHHRPESPFGSPIKIVPQPTSIEAIIHDAARGMYTRGEKWGVNKAVRDAVGEVRKNVQGLQAGRSTHKPWPTNSRDSEKDLNPAALLQKITALEQRNRGLAKMLGGAVSELWDCQKDTCERKDADQGAVESLSVAIAKVQFVQVYLEDSTIPLPMEEVAENSASSADDQAENPPKVPRRPSPKTANSSDSVVTTRRLPIVTSRRKTNSRPQTSDNAPSPVSSDQSSTDGLAGTSSNHRTRPSLAQSSFSWILGGQEPGESFATVSPLDPFEPAGFLFGDDDDELSHSTMGLRKKKTFGIGRKNSGEKKGQADEEVIDLNDIRNGSVA
ncbi:RabGAP/TBC [Saccharata proteae CBS 121410]|uniref:RabGAP/TBC n=1 Tax=Saccharata proteae CBS 121410 TaxID=1314787 RepID=A0A9P4I265_9PEZI|nr:RabGAP/TBC [Saccharata proteae CBS 121410]